ncbi:MAG: LCP family protein, partial [Georgenia sp.]
MANAAPHPADPPSPAPPAGRRHPHLRTLVTVTVSILLLLAAGVVASGLYLRATVQSSVEWIEDPFAGLTDRPEPAGVDPDRPDPAGPAAVPTEAGSAPTEAGGVAAGQDAPAAARPLTILLLGSDSRISAGDAGNWEYGAQRTDAIMLVQFPADRQHAFVMSIPRDSWVDVPGYGMNKINAAYSYGGPSLLIQTVERLTGVRTDHFVVADFESFATLTDALGGVTIDLAEPMSSRGLALDAGTHHLDGAQALIYVRQRYGLPRGDLDRVQRQQNWLRSIAVAGEQERVLSDPARLLGMLELVTGSLAVDEGFDVVEMAALGVSARGISTGDVRFLTAPVAGLGRSPDGRQSVVFLDDARMRALSAAFVTDDVEAYLAAHPDDVEVLGWS